MNTDLIKPLFDKYIKWYINSARNAVNLPRLVAGITEDGNEFSFSIDNLNFNHIDRHHFIKYALESERVISYVYGSLMMSVCATTNQHEELLSVIAANSQCYVWGDWRVIRDNDGCIIDLQHKGTNEGDDPEKYPGAWFLTKALIVPMEDHLKFELIWKDLRRDVQFRTLNNTYFSPLPNSQAEFESSQVNNELPPTPPIRTSESPREVLNEHFESLDEDLPVRGGWGYTKDDACIIDKNDPVVDPSVPFDGVQLEHTFVKNRIYEEMIIFRPEGERFSGIKWNLQEQSLHQDGERFFDKLVFEITAFTDSDWQELKAEYEGPLGYGHPNFDNEAHERKRQEKMVRFTREFWFDITSFYGQGLVIDSEPTGEKKFLRQEGFKFADKLKKLFGID